MFTFSRCLQYTNDIQKVLISRKILDIYLSENLIRSNCFYTLKLTLFIVNTKCTFQLPHVGNRASDVKKFLALQLSRLQMDYVDLYLIHVPFGFHCDPETFTPRIQHNGMEGKLKL